MLWHGCVGPYVELNPTARVLRGGGTFRRYLGSRGSMLLKGLVELSGECVNYIVTRFIQS